MQRLKTRAQFQAVLAGGTVARSAHFALHSVALDTNVPQSPTSLPTKAPSAALFVVDDVWMGAMVPKRWARRAVTRNAIKRQIYTVSQDFAPGLAKVAHLVRLRAGFDKAQFQSASSEALKAAVRQELQRLFEKVVALHHPMKPMNRTESPGSAA